MKISVSILQLAILLSIECAYSQADSLENANITGSSFYSNSIVTDPFLPLFNSFALVYERIYNESNGLVLGFWYGKVTATYPREIKYPGYAHNYALILSKTQFSICFSRIFS